MVSTRMPLAKHDSAHSFNIPSCLSFLLTCLLRGMTVVFRVLLLHPFVSTHMPLARHDDILSINAITSFGFYSHASCEA